MGECGDEMRVWTAESSMTSFGDGNPAFSQAMKFRWSTLNQGFLLAVDHDC